MDIPRQSVDSNNGSSSEPSTVLLSPLGHLMASANTIAGNCHFALAADPATIEPEQVRAFAADIVVQLELLLQAWE